MTYKGYKILANSNATKFWNIDRDGNLEEEVPGIKYDSGNGWDEIWYSVIDKDGWCAQSFETITEAKQYIKEGSMQ